MADWEKRKEVWRCLSDSYLDVALSDSDYQRMVKLFQSMGWTLFKYIKRTFLGFLVFILAYGLIGLILSLLSTSPPAVSCTTANSIYVSTNGVHLDLVIPVEFITGKNGIGVALPSDTKFVSFGWGDQGFYLETPTWDDLRFSVAAKALFWRSKTAMHLTYYRRAASDWNRISLCPQQMEALLLYVRHSFQETTSGFPILIPEKGYGQNDDFYEGKGSYSIIRTCNNWANQGLKTAGVKTAVWSPLDKGVLYQVRKNYPQ